MKFHRHHIRSLLQSNTGQFLFQYHLAGILLLVHRKVNILFLCFCRGIVYGKNRFHLRPLRLVLHVDVRYIDRRNRIQTYPSDDTAKRSARRNLILSPIHFVEVLPVEVPTGIRHTNCQALFFTGLHRFCDIRIER